MKYLTLSLIIVYLIIIFYFSSIPVPEPLRNKPDILLHFIEYGGLGFLFFLHYSELFKKKINGYTMIFIIIFILLYSISDEYHQSFVPGRFSDIKDVIVDFIGGCFTLFLSSYIRTVLNKI